jgi:plastocyanin
MFFATPLIGAAALLSGFTAALPRPDSAIGDEVAVSAPYGTILSDTAALATQTATDGSYSSGYSGSGSGYSDSGSSSQDDSSGGSSQSWTTSTALATATSTYSSQAWTTSAALAAATSSSYASPSYGSGGSSWGNQGDYNSCVQQCMASYGGLTATSAPPTATSDSSGSSDSGSSDSGSSGSGATHTVIVAPTQGVLRYVPFALNASVGDTIEFIWGANEHTVTKSSELTPCNKTSDMLFESGEQNQSFVFTQVVNDTNPTFFYCGTPTHCEKGMFGIINPPNALGAPTSAASMMQPLAANNSDIAAYVAYTNTQTAGNQVAAAWGGGIDMSGLPAWSQAYAAENIMYSRTYFAANPSVIKPDGSVDLSSVSSGSLMVPPDLSAAVNSTGSTSSASPSATSASSTDDSTSGSAISTSSSKVVLGLVVGFASFMML